MGDTWSDPADDPRTYGHPVGELATYREYLTNYRLTIGLKCDGLDAEQLARRSVPPSTLSLLGLVRHLRHVEELWFGLVLRGSGAADRPGNAERQRDFDGTAAEAAVVDAAFDEWQAAVRRSDEWLAGIADRDLGQEVPLDDGSVAVRDVLVHVIEEYARHAGHADLLRECIDGRTGQ